MAHDADVGVSPDADSGPGASHGADESVLSDVVRAVLDRHGLVDWPVRTEEFWCRVTPPVGGHLVQGWKLHVSATPLSACLVLARSADVLARHRCAFKFAATPDLVGRLSSRTCDRGSAGKFITAYPEGGDDRLRELAEDLDRATYGLPGPVVLSDRLIRPGSLVHYRYGVHHGVPTLSDDGGLEAMLVAPDGTLRLDERKPFFSPPEWAPPDPFATTKTAPNPATAPRPEAGSEPGTGSKAGAAPNPEAGPEPATAPRPEAGPEMGTGSRAGAAPESGAAPGTAAGRRAEAGSRAGAGLKERAGFGEGSARRVLLKGRYVVHRAIRQTAAGGVYRATDERTAEAVVVKHARAHTDATLTGRDIRDGRRHEAELLREFESTGLTPVLIDTFEQQNDLFLVEREIPGVTLRQWVAGNLRFDEDRTGGPPVAVTWRLALALVAAVEVVHERGWVFRDLNPDNIMITDDGDLRLIDLELLARPGDLTVRGYTPGYAAPEQVTAPPVGEAPRQEADLYSLGAILFHLVSGADPLLAPDDPPGRAPEQRIDTWLARLSPRNPAAARTRTIITALTRDEPGLRPGLDVVRRFFRTQPAMPGASCAPPPDPTDALARVVVEGIDHLVATMDADNPRRLWPSGRLGGATDPFNVQHGAAGVLGVLVRAHTIRPDPVLLDAVRTAAYWITRHVGREPRVLPGLYFGRAGTAWALLDAGLLLEDAEPLDVARHLARAVPVRGPNPDVCHGAAGAGMTQLKFWESTGEQGFLDRAVEAAEAVAGSARHGDGRVLWPIPERLTSRLAGVVHYGFAHGVAGIGAFLLAVGQAADDPRHVELASIAAETLVSLARERDGAAYWAKGENLDALRTNWCSGSSGVGTFLVRAWRQTGDERLRGLACRAAVAVHRARWTTGTAQCHGLAGDGEFLLDLAEATRCERYRRWAEDLGAALLTRDVVRDGRLLVADESLTTTFADYNTGLSGILAYLIRLRHGGSRMWLPRASEIHSPPSAREIHSSPSAKENRSPPSAGETRSQPRGGDDDGNRCGRSADAGLRAGQRAGDARLHLSPDGVTR